MRRRRCLRRSCSRRIKPISAAGRTTETAPCEGPAAAEGTTPAKGPARPGAAAASNRRGRRDSHSRRLGPASAATAAATPGSGSAQPKPQPQRAQPQPKRPAQAGPRDRPAAAEGDRNKRSRSPSAGSGWDSRNRKLAGSKHAAPQHGAPPAQGPAAAEGSAAAAATAASTPTPPAQARPPPKAQPQQAQPLPMPGAASGPAAAIRASAPPRRELLPKGVSSKGSPSPKELRPGGRNPSPAAPALGGPPSGWAERSPGPKPAFLPALLPARRPRTRSRRPATAGAGCVRQCRAASSTTATSTGPGGLVIVEEPDHRMIERQDGRAFIRHDEAERFRLFASRRRASSAAAT